MKRLVWVGAAAAALAVLVAALVPSGAASPTGAFTPTWPVVRGAFHVHSVRSDGTGTLDEIAEAAADAGLQFVIVTDHGNATEPPEPPRYRSGVLTIDAVEISTDGGHLVALGLPRAPYPLAGHPDDVLEDVHRLGAVGIAAHPGSPKDELRWGDWGAAFDGIEWLNADSEWRDEMWGSLGRVLLTYYFRPPETLVRLLDRPVGVLTAWDTAVQHRRVAAIAGADAHARLGWRQTREPYEDRVLLRAPSYEASFRAFANHVILDGPLTGDGAVDAPRVLEAIREGRVFTSISGMAELSAFEAKATSGRAIARVGEYLDPQGGPVAIDARVGAPAGTTLVVLKDGEPVYDSAASAIRVDVGTQAGAYRIEARLPGPLATSTVPWLLTNPIYVGMRAAHAQRARRTDPSATTARTPLATAAWRAEAGAGCESALHGGPLSDGSAGIVWRFSLAGPPRAEQYAAVSFPIEGGLADHDRLQLSAESDRPMRLWVQIRASGVQGGQRWGRSFHVDPSLRSLEWPLASFRPMEPRTTPAAPPLDRIDSLLLVIDTLNTLPGTSGAIRIAGLSLVK
jgi:hypothetical protein